MIIPGSKENSHIFFSANKNLSTHHKPRPSDAKTLKEKCLISSTTYEKNQKNTATVKIHLGFYVVFFLYFVAYIVTFDVVTPAS
jgi:hypothetical protein